MKKVSAVPLEDCTVHATANQGEIVLSSTACRCVPCLGWLALNLLRICFVCVLPLNVSLLVTV